MEKEENDLQSAGYISFLIPIVLMIILISAVVYQKMRVAEMSGKGAGKENKPGKPVLKKAETGETGIEGTKSEDTEG